MLPSFKEGEKMNLWNLFFFSFLTENIVLTRFLGICPFIGTTKSTKNAWSMGIAVTLVIMCSSILTYFLYYGVLVPTDTTYLKTIVFILVIACLVQSMELVIKKHFPKVEKSLGIYLPLITTNCAVLGVVLLNISNHFTFLEAMIFSIGSSMGFVFVSILFASIREYLDTKNVPEWMQGTPIAFVIASIMTLIFSTLGGIL